MFLDEIYRIQFEINEYYDGEVLVCLSNVYNNV